MTHRVVGSEPRPRNRERDRFAWALVFSGLLHASVLMLPGGPPSGKRFAAVAAAGALEASLRPAAPEAPPSPSLPTPPASPLPTPGMPLVAVMVMPSPTSPVSMAEPAAAASPPIQESAVPSSGTAPATAQREGAAIAADAAGEGDTLLAIPALPPLVTAARELPRRPSLLAPVSFTYPRDVRLQGGQVRVRILLDNKGNVEDMRVVNAIPPGVFDRAALSVLRSARYAPGFAGPIPLRSYLYMDVSFGPGALGQQVWYAGSAAVPPGS